MKISHVWLMLQAKCAKIPLSDPEILRITTPLGFEVIEREMQRNEKEKISCQAGFLKENTVFLLTRHHPPQKLNGRPLILSSLSLKSKNAINHLIQKA